MWHARKYPDCKTWTVFDDAGGGTIASKMTEDNAKHVARLRDIEKCFGLTCAALGVKPENALQADQVAADRMRELRELRSYGVPTNSRGEIGEPS